MRGRQLCSCDDKGFGRFIPNSKGLIKQSISLNDLLSMLKHYIELIRNKQGIYGDREEKVVLEKNVKHILESISTNIWKCFNIIKALHPYSVEALVEMREIFKVSDLIPTLNGRFVNTAGVSTVDQESDGEDYDDEEEEESSDDDDEEEEDESINKEASFTINNCTGADDVNITQLDINDRIKSSESNRMDGFPHKKLVISVDDMSIYKLLEPVLKAKKLDTRICWMDGCVVNPSNTNEFTNVDTEYNTNNLNNSIINLSPEEFMSVTTTIADNTFKAPKTTVSLFKFLDIPSLSRIVEESWTEGDLPLPPSSTLLFDSSTIPTCQPATLIMSSLNALLEVAQRFLNKNGRGDLCETLTQSIRFQSLFELKVSECADLRRQLCLNLSSFGPAYKGVIVEAEESLSYHRGYNTTQTLVVNKSISPTVVLQLCVDLIMQPMRIEVALRDKNQSLELMDNLRSLMIKFSKSPLSQFPFLFDHEEILPLPDHITPWVMVQIVIEETVEAIKEEKEEEEESPAAMARREAYERLRGESQSRAMSVAKDRMEKTEKFIDLEKTKLKEINDRRIAALSEDLIQQSLEPSNQNNLLISAEDELFNGEKERLPLLVSHFQGQRGPRVFVNEPSMQGEGEGGLSNGYSSECMIGEMEGEIERQKEGDKEGERGDVPGEGHHMLLNGSSTHNNSSNNDFMSTNNRSFEGSSGTYQGGFFDVSSSRPIEGSGGKGFGGGLYDPSVSRPNAPAPHPVNLKDILSKESFSREFLSSIGGFSEGCNDENMSELILSDNAVSGRVGEYWASEYLTSQANTFGFLSVDWLNKECEQGKPYDIQVEIAEGVYRFCEVKTRSFDTAKYVDINQWFISPKEVLLAQEKGFSLFALCLSISVDRQEGTMTPQSTFLLGMEGGLLQSFLTKESSLTLQVHKRTDSTNVRADSTA
eukprot:CAMPEP_0119053330 /NCGR_PEP_ID=MMETSP1177-20130426/74359_1 /TAXON_ID=2985 /ORGANISM="Ochromonas sp, Strain CCMP1899" /LENGTH=931 /DNA_ID=CAMNT_0007033255 /DNA_START=3359 /DNA_END=6154 /DNA_ORIENTATION=-